MTDGPPGGVPTVGDLAIVLHSHMPYVEGHGTFPFGEEWLFDAVAGSYLPVLEVARELTMTVTPVLADQLEAGGVGERILEFLRRYRLGSAERDAAEAAEDLRPPAAAAAESCARAIARLEQLDGDALVAFQEAGARVELMTSAATHAVLPKLATLPGRRLQVDAGLRSHARRFGEPAGFWLPECAYAPGVEAALVERGLDYTCLDLSAREPDGGALAPISLPGGLTAFTIDWPAVDLVWSRRGYPSDPVHLEYHRLSRNGMRLWAIGGGPYDPAAARERAAEQAREFLDAVRERLAAHAASGTRGLCVFAIDTELLGHWWAEGPHWLAELLRAAPGAGVRLLRLSEALREHEPEARPAFESSWGEGKSLETWDSPAVRDLAWASRRLELRLLDALAAGLDPGSPGAARAARELLAVQSSDWAFMDHRGQAGDYPFKRATGHAEAMLEALAAPERAAPRQRHLAPDLSLAPLLEP